MSTSGRIIKNTGFLYLRTIVSLLLSVFTTRFILQGLGESDFGLYNVVGGSISMLGFLTASLSTSTQRFINYAQGQNDEIRIRKIFANSLIVHHILAIGSILLFGVGGFVLFNGILNIPAGQTTEAVIVYICMLVSTLFSITIVPYDAEITAHEDMKVLSFIGILDVFLKLLIALSILKCQTDQLIIYAVLMALESFLTRWLTKFYCTKKYPECRNVKLRADFDKHILKDLSSFAGWNTLNMGTSMIALFSMNVVINHYFGTICNASMGIATQLAGVIMGISLNLNKAITPVIMKSEGKSDRISMLRYSLIGCKFAYLIFLLICIPILLNISYILKLWLNDVPDYAAIFCFIMILSHLLEQLTVIFYQSIMAEGHIRSYSILRSISNLAPIFISMIMFQYGDFPPYWILINWLIWKPLIGGIINIFISTVKLDLNLSKYMMLIVRLFFVTVACIGISYLADRSLSICNPSVHKILSIILSYLLCLGAIYLLGLNRQERIQTNKLFSNISKKCLC